MQIEILALHHQLAVLQRQKKRVILGAWVKAVPKANGLLWNQWRSALVVVKSET